MLALVVFGIFALVQLKTDEFPDVSPPIVSVAVPYPGASPDTVEREVIDPIEEQISAISGVKKIQSNALDSFGVITVEFIFAKDLQEATQDIRDGISQIRNDLPPEMEEPILTKFDPNDFPIVQLTLASKTLTGGDLTRIADPGLTRQLRGVTGVAEVRVVGGIEREMTIALKPQALQAAGIGVGEVVQALQTQNLAAPVGRLNGTLDERTIRLLGRLDTPADFARIVIAQRNGKLIRLGDVAEAIDGTEEPRTAALFNGRDAVGIDIIKADGYSATEVSERVGKRVDEIRKTLPAGVELITARDAGPRVANSVSDVQCALHRRRRADRAGRVPVPELVALDRHHGPGAAGLGDGLLCRGVGLRLHARHDVAARPVARHRHPHRRRDRRAREHRAARRDGEGPLHGVARRHRRDRPGRRGHDAVDRGGLRAGGVHGRPGGPVVQAVCADHRLLGDGVAVCVLLARPDAVGVLARPAPHARTALVAGALAGALQHLVRSAGRALQGRHRLGARPSLRDDGAGAGLVCRRAGAAGRGHRRRRVPS